MMNLFITNGACGLLILLVNYCDVFISYLDFHSDGTHSLQRIHCCAATFFQIFSIEETNSSTSWIT